MKDRDVRLAGRATAAFEDGQLRRLDVSHSTSLHHPCTHLPVACGGSGLGVQACCVGRHTQRRTSEQSFGESQKLFNVIAQLLRDVTILLIEHDMNLVFRFTERTTVLVGGHLLVEGTPVGITADRARMTELLRMECSVSGVCGTCLTAILAHTHNHRETHLTEQERASNGRMPPCVPRSLSPAPHLDL
jgi:hypothetical protein